MTNSFSIVTPNYNMGKYLPETIESVLRNIRAGDEYFIIDGGSTDDSVDIIRYYESHLTGWVSEPDRGYADALAKGFALSRGTYQCWINSGDILLEGTIDLACKILQETKADFIFGDDLYIDEDGRVLQHSSGYVRSLSKSMLYGGWTPLQDACFWKKELYDSVTGLDTSLKFAADYALFLAMSHSGYCKYVQAVFSAFRKHTGQKSIISSREYAWERRAVRQSMINRLQGNRLKDYLLSTIYYCLMWKKAHYGNKVRKPLIKDGTNISDISAFTY